MAFADNLHQLSSNVQQGEVNPREKLKLATLERYQVAKKRWTNSARNGHKSGQESFYDIDYGWTTGRYRSYSEWVNANWIDHDSPCFKDIETANYVKSIIEEEVRKDGFKNYDVKVIKLKPSSLLNKLLVVEVEVRW